MAEQTNGIARHIEGEYAAILRFATAHNAITYEQLDAATMREVNLFALREGFNFEAFEETLDRIIAALPAIKRIFARPIMRLKDAGELLPVESVRVINNRTLSYASVHSETWDSVTEEGVRPKKLLTLKHEDSYVTYENIGFAKAITVIFRLVAGGTKQLSDAMFASRDMRFNLLERENHLAYFLAIGKLHVGYVHNYDRYKSLMRRCTDKLLYIDRALGNRRRAPVYKSCKDKVEKFVLKKSTTFRVHKDYNQIYLLLKWFADTRLDTIEEEEEEDEEAENAPGYTAYCNLISLFAAGHFGFVFRNAPMNPMLLDARARFKGYRLELRTLTVGKKKALLLSVKKDKQYRILLLPDGKPTDLDKFRTRCRAEEFLIAAPADKEGCVYLSLFDVESFRRVQQLLLRAMVYADEKRDTCPFCGDALEKDSKPLAKNISYACGACRTRIIHTACPKTETPFFASTLKGYLPPHLDFASGSKRERLLYKKQLESSLFFRNITPIERDGVLLCPHCGEDHGMA